LGDPKNHIGFAWIRRGAADTLEVRSSIARAFMSAPEPIATGTLAKTPLPHLLVYLEQKKLSGTLVIWPEPEDTETKRQDRILLLKGIPVAGKLIEPTTNLREGMLKLFARARAPYAFYGTNLLGDDRVSGRVDPLALIAESLRVTARDDVVDGLLARFGKTKLRMQQGVELARFELQPAENGLIELLRAEPADVATLVAGSGLPEARARRLVYLLAITKSAAPYDENPTGAPVRQHSGPIEAPAEPAAAAPAAEAPAAAAPLTSLSPPADAGAISGQGSMHGRLDRLQSIPPPPTELSDELKQRWLRVVAKGRLIENQNYFEMIEVDKDTKSGEARAKFYQLAKEWHPDRLPTEMQSLREYVQIIFSYMSEANATLGDEGQRVKYVQTVREGGGTPATERLMQSILDTAMEYERVLVLSRRHQYDEAIELMKKILAVMKDDAEYHWMYAWLMMQKFPGQGQEAPLRQMLEAVDKALAQHERHEKANLLKAQILRRMGKTHEAQEYFRKVAEINPRNIDAMREVRVATMRSGGAPPSKGGKQRQKPKRPDSTGVGGLLGKIFKKD
jgi:tetratricopeptide (TPR) repeat protein